MQNVIVGTAGHVDHGKTCLIRALTGIDTDRLMEEKKRGITIDLGFASLMAEDGLKIGIIDVPGHEKFVKNMLAGIGGIDLVLLVIALDEGVMPQTVEHFEILKMLGIPRGIIALTKFDTVEEDWAEMVEEDVDALVKGSFLENARRIRVSAYTGENIPLLKEEILRLARLAGKRREEPELMRLPVDRVFVMEGFGTVVTGTLLEGQIAVGEEVMLYPSLKRAKVRGIQNHGISVSYAPAGTRTAVNLSGLSKEEIERGQVLSRPGTLINSHMMDARVTLFETTSRPLKSGSRVHVNYGSAQVIAKAVLLDTDVLEAGETAFVQFRFDDPVSVRRRDRFIIRFLSPVETFGGGIVLDAHPGKHKHGRSDVIESLKIRETGSEEEVLEQILLAEGLSLGTLQELSVELNETAENTRVLLENLKKRKKVLSLSNGTWMHVQAWKPVGELAKEILGAFHEENPILDGMEKEELKSRLRMKLYMRDAQAAEVLLAELKKRGILDFKENRVFLKGFEATYSSLHSAMAGEILRIYREAGFEAKETEQVARGFEDSRQASQMIQSFIKDGSLVRIQPGLCLAKEPYEEAIRRMRDYFASHETMSLAEYRDLLGTSRKYVQPLLEHFDKKKLTRMQGDVRIPLQGLNMGKTD